MISHWIYEESSNPEWLREMRIVWDEGNATIEGVIEIDAHDYVSCLKPRVEDGQTTSRIE